MPIISNLLIFSPTLQDALVNKNGLPLAAGVITCYKDNSRTTLKNWYYQTGTPGNYTYVTLPNPMVLSGAGTIQDLNGNDVIPGFYPYSEIDADTREPYYITVDNSDGQRQFTRANFPFVGIAQQGPAIVPTLQNLITNSNFWRNIGTIDVTNPQKSTLDYYSPLTIYYDTIAPSQHDGFLLPDINFCKDAKGGTDKVTFEKFPADPTSGSQQLIGDVTPEYYCKITCTIPGAETLKFVSIPIQLHINNLINTDYVATIQARVTNGIATSMIMGIYQQTGTGGDLSDAPLTETRVLSSDWNQFELRGTFPTVQKNVGAGGDDAYYLVIFFPTGQLLEVNIAMPSLYLGVDVPTNSWATYDQTGAIIDSPRTGDIRTSINTFYPYGWVPMNDGTLGYSDITVTTTSKPTARNNKDTWQLYELLWNYAKKYDTGSNFNPICQMYTNAKPPVATNYGTSAYSDFTNEKYLSLTKMFGRVMAGNVPLDALLPDVYSQTFTATNTTTTFTVTASSTTVTVPAIGTLINGQLITVSSATTLPAPLVTNTPYYIQSVSGNTFSLSTTQNGSPITFTNIGTGTHTLNTQMVLNVTAGAAYYIGMAVTVKSAGTLPGGLTKDTIYYVANIAGNTIALATNYANATAGFPVLAYVDAGTGVHTILSQVTGITVGEYFHRLNIGELPVHNHELINPAPGSVACFGGGTGIGGGLSPITGYNLSIGNTGGNVPHQNMQPSTFYNVYIKL